MGKTTRLEICTETARNLRDEIQQELKIEGRLDPVTANIWNNVAKKDAAYHSRFGFRFLTDQRGQRSRRWMGYKLHG